jgi:hypothetical protein
MGSRVIESGIPLPPEPERVVDPDPFSLDLMKVGDSFEFQEWEYVHLGMAIAERRRQRRRPGERYAIRCTSWPTLERPEKPTVFRIWRAAEANMMQEQPPGRVDDRYLGPARLKIDGEMADFDNGPEWPEYTDIPWWRRLRARLRLFFRRLVCGPP